MKTPHSFGEPWYLERWFISGTYNEPSQKPKRSTFLFHEQGNTGRTHNILAGKRAEHSSPLTNSLKAQKVNEEKNHHWPSLELRQILDTLLSSPSTEYKKPSWQQSWTHGHRWENVYVTHTQLHPDIYAIGSQVNSARKGKEIPFQHLLYARHFTRLWESSNLSFPTGQKLLPSRFKTLKA